MNRASRTPLRLGIVFLLAIVGGASIGGLAFLTKSHPKHFSDGESTHVDQALAQLQKTFSEIREISSTSSTTSTKPELKETDRDPLGQRYAQVLVTLERAQLDHRLHRIRHDLLPELNRLEASLLGGDETDAPSASQSQTSGVATSANRFNQFKIIDDLRHELEATLASLERQRASLR